MKFYFSVQARLIAVFGVIIAMAITSTSPAQIHSKREQQFLLQSINPPVESAATLDSERLIIYSANGGSNVYTRNSRYDSADQKYVAYVSRQLQRVIRWPINNAGSMKIGQPTRSGEIKYRQSKMLIVVPGAASGIENLNSRITQSNQRIESQLKRNSPKRGGNNRSETLQNNQLNGSLFPEDWLHRSLPILLSQTLQGNQFLTCNKMGRFQLSSNPRDRWYLIPIANDLVRIETRQDRLIQALSCTASNEPIFSDNVHSGPSHLWRVAHSPGGGYLIESVANPGYALTWQNQNLALAPLNFLAAQIWHPTFPTTPWNEPILRSVQSEIVPNPQLPPAEVRLFNKSKNSVFIILGDRETNRVPEQLKIEPFSEITVTLQRDAGAEIIERFEERDPYGGWRQQEFRTPIPPRVFYDISVYEEFLQSIAIDSTDYAKKNGQRIMDLNHQPKSVGFFLVPPGDELPQRATVDVITEARAARNPGGVRQLNREHLGLDGEPQNPLEDLLLELQSKGAAF